METRMISYLILTAVGLDRSGLVDEVSEYLSDNQMNIESSRMSVLGGEFAMILLVSGEESDALKIQENISKLEDVSGLTFFYKKTGPPEERSTAASLPYRIVTAGMDHPGIVHDISKLLRGFEVNIEALDTKVISAPVSGSPMFTMTARLLVPAEVKISKIKKSLMELGDDLNMDIEFEPES
jgi:glycine cleavage system transcriptional repressor